MSGVGVRLVVLMGGEGGGGRESGVGSIVLIFRQVSVGQHFRGKVRGFSC